MILVLKADFFDIDIEKLSAYYINSH